MFRHVGHGGRQADKIVGGPGADGINGGLGRDLIMAGRGGDRIVANDGMRDHIICGAGFDAVKADRRDRVARDCERVVRVRPDRPEDTHFAYNFFAHYDRAIGFLVKPRATAFWNAAVEWSHTLGSSLRIFYNGNGQTYALFILIYFVAMVVLNGGLAQ